ncbi:hypothetical protein AGMMS49543_27260 [Betaproteobacteria bacterium]|nr:hypothetical protein AGMMS49543_27260 [Betaproteobacteria bacterium]GHU24594.1 hypothetical protein AGMMS50243_27910 [Betaproteobacteria bacterium]
MTHTPARTMDFFDRSVGTLIAERVKVDGLSALRKFMRSETYHIGLNHRTKRRLPPCPSPFA